MTRKKTQSPDSFGESEIRRLEMVVKCDVAGTEEAIRASLAAIQVPGVAIAIIQSGVGNISKSDILMAQTGSRLVIGFNVDVMPKLEQEIKEHGIEVRIYDTIYNLTEDLKKIAHNQFAKEPQDSITGRAKVIATFRGGHKDMIIGCEVLDGVMELGKNFRVITAMGPVYAGKIASLQVERENVKAARSGQQVGIKIADWNKAKVGDLVECYETIQPAAGPWKPRPGVFRSNQRSK
jgi:translation initiation factor IF-2